MEHVGFSFPAHHALGRRGCPSGKKGQPASGCNRKSLKIIILLCAMALPTNLTLPWTSWRNPCPKRSLGKNLGQKTLCQAIVFSCVMSWVCWRNLPLAVLSLLQQKVSQCLGLVGAGSALAWLASWGKVVGLSD